MNNFAAVVVLDGHVAEFYNVVGWDQVLGNLWYVEHISECDSVDNTVGVYCSTDAAYASSSDDHIIAQDDGVGWELTVVI